MILALILGVALGFFIRKKVQESKVDSIEKYTRKLLTEAQKEAKSIKKEAALQAKDTLYQMKLEFEKETREKKEQLHLQEKRLFSKEENLEKKSEQLDKREGRVVEKERTAEKIEGELRKKEREYHQLVEEQRKRLESIAGISAEEAKQLLIGAMESEAKHDAAKLIRRIENEARSEADRKAQNIVALAVKRYAGD
ncbi:MAG TPA: DUF3552 domain-containing protein, partial [Desulfobacteraceae bacterium]|nr:DUF3552 domain-containing protein [Desulfobacteraceae bacterium]